MSAAAGLTEHFLRHAPMDGGSPPAERLEPLLRRMWDQGRAAWPGAVVPAEVFVRHLAERLPSEKGIEEGLGSRCGADLYLACACAEGQAAALALFDRHFLAQVPAYVGHLRPSAAVLDEVQHWAIGFGGVVLRKQR